MTALLLLAAALPHAALLAPAPPRDPVPEPVARALAGAGPGEESYSSAAFTYVGGGRNDCSGAEVYDPDLQKEVRVCHPIGDYYDEGTLVVHKRTNTLGAVMLDGRVLP